MRKIDKDIMRLSLPAIVSNVTVPLLGICDTAISGHLGSEIYLAAIAVGSVMLNVVFWLFGFLRAGTTGLTATAYGAGRPDHIRQVFSQALFLAFSAGILLIVFQTQVKTALLFVIHAEEGVASLVDRYFSICIWGAPAILGVMAISGWFVGMQNTAYPMAIAIAVNIINICLSFMLVFLAGAGFEGVAWGTLGANWCGLVLAFGCVVWFRRGEKVWCGISGMTAGGGVGRFFKVNISLFFRSAFIISVSLGMASAGARLGALTLAVNVIGMQFFQFFSFFMDGFAFSAEALVGNYAGACDSRGVRESVRALLRWTLAIALLFTVLYLSGCEGVARVLSDSGDVCDGIAALRLWIGLVPIVSAWAFIFDGFYIGATDTNKMMWATMVSTIVFYLIAFIRYDGVEIRFGVSDNYALWSAFLCYLMLRGVILAGGWSMALRRKGL